MDREWEIVNQVASSKPARFTDKPVGPLESHNLHPGRSSLDVASY